MSGQDPSQIELSNPPTDGISSVLFCKTAPHLVVTSWDKSVTVHDVSSIWSNNTPSFNNHHNSLKTKVLLTYEHSAAVLDSCLHSNGDIIYSAGCDFQIQSCNLASAMVKIVGEHSMPVRCIEYCDNAQILISGSWDKTIKLWDIRQASFSPNNGLFSLCMQYENKHSCL